MSLSTYLSEAESDFAKAKETSPLGDSLGNALANFPKSERKALPKSTNTIESIIPEKDGACVVDDNTILIRKVQNVDSWVLPVILNGVQTYALIDSGASCCLLSKAVYDLMAKSRYRLKSGNRVITGVGGRSLTTLGEMTVQVGIGGKDWPMNMAVSSENETVGCYLGMDFFRKYECDFSVRTGTFTLGGVSLPMKKESQSNVCARVRMGENTILPARSEMVIRGKAEKTIRQVKVAYGLLEPSGRASRLCQHGISVGAALTAVGGDYVPVPVVNTSDREFLLRKGTTIAILKPATHVQGWQETSNGCEVLRTPLMSGHKSGESKATEDGSSSERVRKTGLAREACRERRQMCPNDLPDHLKPLVENLAEDITVKQKEIISAAIYEYRDVFSEGPEDMGCTSLVTHTIDTGENRPIRIPPRRLPIAKQAIEREEVDKMLKRDVIEPSASPWASPIVLVTKKDGSTRFCIDYRKLNDVTRKDAYPLPRIDDTLDALSGSLYFSTLDLYSGYWQVEMDPRDKEKTAFTTRQGLFQWKVMPFGLCNAPATFERLMELVLCGLTWQMCLVYIDDVIVFGDSFDQALDHLIAVWERMRKARLKLKPAKCFLFRDQVPFLGHVVTRDGVQVDPQKTKVVSEWPVPRMVKDVRSFLGLASYYRRFIPGFATVAAPMVRLTRKDAGKEVVWTDECQVAFDTLKDALSQSPVLSYPLREGKFIVSTDASDDGVGAVLEQEQIENGKKVVKVVAYASKTLSRSQRKYCATNRELLAVVTALEQF